MADLDERDRELAERYGPYASYYDSGTAPAATEYYGETPPHLELGRLLDVYVRPETRALDIGCGAGFATCRIAASAQEVWGFDQDVALLAAAAARARSLGLRNVTLVEGNIARSEDVARLPADRFDLAWSQRGPNITANLMRTLTQNAIVVQELVSSFDGYPLREVFGRRAYSPYHYNEVDVLLHRYADLGLFPISVKSYFYDQYFRDAEHLAGSLRRGAWLSDWRVPESGGFRPEQDRAALDLYVRYNTTSRGVRVMGQRVVLVLRRAVLNYYPVNGTPM